MICPSCGKENRPDARFCDGCGSPVATVPLAKDALTEDVPTSSDETKVITLDLPDPASQPAAQEDAEELERYSRTAYLSPSMTQEMPALTDVDGAEKKAYKAFGNDAKPKKTPHIPMKRKGVIAVVSAIAAVLILLGAAFAAYQLQLWGGKEVPDVVGLEAAEATSRLEAAGFTSQTVLVKSDDVEGIVLSTNPQAGSRAEQGAEVTIDVSCARVIPDVMGKPLEEALGMLAQEGYENIEQATERSNEPEGTVISVTPDVGVRTKAQAKVVVTTSVPYVVPDVSGMSFDEAKSTIESEGFVATSAYTYTEDAEEGAVVGTDPAGGTQIEGGSEVCILIAKSRAAEVSGWARAWFEGAKNYTKDGVSYELQSIESISYAGDDACSFTVVMRPYETHSWFGSQPETRYGNDQKIQGTIKFSSDGQLSSIDPALKKA